MTPRSPHQGLDEGDAMTTDTATPRENGHARYLRLAAKDIREAGHNGWGNTCEWAAAEIDRLSEREGQLRECVELLTELGEWDDTLTTKELAALSARARTLLARIKGTKP